MDKKQVIDDFLASLTAKHHKQVKSFIIICKKCGSNDVTMYHGCDYYHYSSYTNGFDEKCGIKCKGCGAANEIAADDEDDGE